MRFLGCRSERAAARVVIHDLGIRVGLRTATPDPELLREMIGFAAK
jgi:hypothetical protein